MTPNIIFPPSIKTMLAAMLVFFIGCNNYSDTDSKPQAQKISFTKEGNQYHWNNELCAYTGIYDALSVSQRNLKGTDSLRKLFVSEFPLETQITVEHIDKMDMLAPDALTKEYLRKRATLEKLEIVDNSFWKLSRKKFINALEDYYNRGRILQRAVDDPSELENNDFGMENSRYAKLISSSNIKVLIKEIRKLKRNENPSEDNWPYNDTYFTELNEFEQLRQARLELIRLIYVPKIGIEFQKARDLSLLHKEFKDIFISVTEDCTEKKVVALMNEVFPLMKEEKFIQAFKSSNKAWELAQLAKLEHLYWKIISYRGMIFFKLGDLKRARIDYKTALRYSSTEAATINSYNNLSSAYADQEVLDSSFYYLEEARVYCFDGKPSIPCRYLYGNMAYTYFLGGKIEEALAVITDHLDLDTLKIAHSEDLYPGVLHTLGEIYITQEKFEKAIAKFEESFEHYEMANSISDMILAKEGLVKSYEMRGDLLSSFNELKKLDSLKTRRYDIDVKKEIAKIENEKFLEIKEEEISNLETENQEIEQAISKSRWFIYILGMVSIVSLVAILYRGHRHKLQDYRLRNELAINRMSSLRSMMNPHFLFNSFSTLQNFILKKEDQKANEYMTELSGLIRQVLSNSSNIYTGFNEEVALLRSYIRLEQERFSEHFAVTFDIDGSLTELNPTIPSMIIQPFIENAIVHGFSGLSHKGLLEIQMIRDTEYSLRCLVRDNGVGRLAAAKQAKNQKQNHLSIATKNTDERLRILEEMGNSLAKVDIIDLYDSYGKSTGTEVTIILPLTIYSYTDG